MQSDLLVHGILAAKDPGPPVTPALLLLLGEEVGHEVVVVAVADIRGLDNRKDALHGAFVLLGVCFLHI